MFFCFLCAKEFKGNNKGVEIDRKINELTTFEEAIKEQILNYEVLLSPSSKVTCAGCFNCFKSFYELISSLNKRLKQIENSKTVKSLIKTLEIHENKILSENLNLGPEIANSKYPKIALDSDFEWDFTENEFIDIGETKINENKSESLSVEEQENIEANLRNKSEENPENLIPKNSRIECFIIGDLINHQNQSQNIFENTETKTQFIHQKYVDDEKNHEKIIKDQKNHAEIITDLKTQNESENQKIDSKKSPQNIQITFKATNFIIEPLNIQLESQNQNEPNLNHKKKILTDLKIKSQAKSSTSTYTRYLPRYQVTEEMLKSNQTSIVIDGVEYKIPKRKFKQIKSKVSKIRGDDPNRRKHPSLDPENEKKIREFVEVKCHICETDFESFSKVKKHFKRFHENCEAFLICCDKKFTQRSHLLDHIEWHDKSKVHRCEICNKEYKNKVCLRAHNKMCHSDIYQECICSQCGKTCKNEITLRNHLKNHEIDSTRTFECYGCKKQFKNSHVLRIHLQKAHGGPGQDREIICHICSTQVKSKHFKQHLKIHQDREKIKCDVCSRWLLKESMIIHMKKHNDMGASCTICGKFLKYSAYLPRHMKIAHSDDHKYKCDHCQKPFHKKTKLLEHVAAKHTREILFRCRVEGCGREFRAEGNWKVHEKKFHPEEYEKFFKPNYLRNPESETND